MIEYVAIGLMVFLATAVALIAIGLGTIFGPKKNQQQNPCLMNRA